MKKSILCSEWKKLYPIKKLILVLIEAFLSFSSFVGLCQFSAGDFEEWEFVIGLIIVSIVCLPPIYRYVRIPFRCVPGVSKYFSRQELISVIGQQNFEIPAVLQDTGLGRRILVSEHWFCIANHYIPRYGILAMWRDAHVHEGTWYERVYFLLMTGDVIKVNFETSFGSVDHSVNMALQESTSGIGLGRIIGLNRVEQKWLKQYSKYLNGLWSSYAEQECLLHGKNYWQEKQIEEICREFSKLNPAPEIWLDVWKEQKEREEKEEERSRRIAKLARQKWDCHAGRRNKN